jgi:hypothetical protein
VNLVIDKGALVEAVGGPEVADAAGHLVLDSIEGDLLQGYAPLGAEGGEGNLAAAEEVMRTSRYDRDRDGRCDDPSCEGVTMLAFFRFTEEQARSMAADLERLGIVVEIVPDPPDDELDPWRDPAGRAGLYAGGPWAKDTLDAAPFYRAIFDSRWSMTDESTNGNLVGASAERLAAWGYPPTDLPSVDDRIDVCSAQVDPTSQVRCWADLDVYMMEAVVPWVPLYVESYIVATGRRVVAYSFAQLTAMPALDRIALAPGS